MGHHESMCIYPSLHYIQKECDMNIVNNFSILLSESWCGGELFALSHDGASENSCNLHKMPSKSHSRTKTVSIKHQRSYSDI